MSERVAAALGRQAGQGRGASSYRGREQVGAGERPASARCALAHGRGDAGDGPGDLDALFDPVTYRGATDRIIDDILALYEEERAYMMDEEAPADA